MGLERANGWEWDIKHKEVNGQKFPVDWRKNDSGNESPICMGNLLTEVGPNGTEKNSPLHWMPVVDAFCGGRRSIMVKGRRHGSEAPRWGQNRITCPKTLILTPMIRTDKEMVDMCS